MSAFSQMWWMAHGHQVIVALVLAVLFGARLHVRVVRNGSKFPKLKLDVWFEGRNNGKQEAGHASEIEEIENKE